MSCSAADSDSLAIVDVEAMEAKEDERDTGSTAEERCSVACTSSAFIVFVAGGAAAAGADGAMETLDVATSTGTSFSVADSGGFAIVEVVAWGATAASVVGAMEAEDAAFEAMLPADERCCVACAS